MSGEKQRHRWRRSPILIEEKLTIDSKSTTTSRRTDEEKHIENTIRKWYSRNEESDERNQQEISSRILPANESLAGKIERVLRRINAWTNEISSSSTATTSNHLQREPLQDISFNKTNLSTYEKIRLRQTYQSHQPTNSFRQRCCSSTYTEPDRIQSQQISTHRPFSMVFINEPFPSTCLLTNEKYNYSHRFQGQERKVRAN